MATAAAAMTQWPVTLPLVAHQDRKRKANTQGGFEGRALPGKDPKHESAAERRRTQIRLAQRAYRQRKETTIETLRQQVAELTSTIKSILKDSTNGVEPHDLSGPSTGDLAVLLPDFDIAKDPFTQRNHIQASNSLEQDDKVMQDLNVLSTDLLQDTYAYEDNAGSQSDNEPVRVETDYLLMHGSPIINTSTQRRASSMKDTIPRASPNHIPSEAPVVQHTPLSLPPRLQRRHQRHESQSQVTRPQRQLGQTNKTSDLHNQIFLERIATPFLNAQQYEASMVPGTKTVTPITSYCHYEKNFARRLQRVCIEAGYQILLDPSRAPRAFERIFRLHLSTGSDRNVLLQRFAAAVERDINANLDSQNSPFSYTGGTGLLYQSASNRNRADNNGAEKLLSLNPIISSIPGISGEWLDSSDVQTYLHERGIKVDGSASYIQACIPIDNLIIPTEHTELHTYLHSLSRYSNFEDIEQFHRRFLEPESVPPISSIHKNSYPHITCDPFSSYPSDYISDHSFGSGRTGTSRPSPKQAESVSSIEEMHLEQPLPKTLQPMNLSELWPDEQTDTGLPYNEGEIWNVSESERLTVTLDVCKLMKILLLGSVCMGRVPGFRRWHVDCAIRGSVVTSF